VTQIFHPNIAKNGEICVNTLKKDWKPTLGLHHVLLVIRCLLIEPFPESALNEEAGKMLMEDYEGYAKHARYSPYPHVEYYFWKVSTFFSGKVCIGSSFTIHVWPFPL
jgi:ubiquitin-protein ligase